MQEIIRYPESEQLFKQLEATLGFELYQWQKIYICTGDTRRTGKTTAHILRQLLDVNAVPLVMVTRKDVEKIQDEFNHPAQYSDLYRRELLKMKEKLDAAGIQTRDVITSRSKLRAYLEERRKNEHSNVKDTGQRTDYKFQPDRSDTVPALGRL